MVVQHGLVAGGVGELHGGEAGAEVLGGEVVEGVLVNLCTQRRIYINTSLFLTFLLFVFTEPPFSGWFEDGERVMRREG